MRVLHVINSIGLSGGAEQQLEANLRAFSDERNQDEHLIAYLFEFGETSRAPGMSTAKNLIHINRGRVDHQPLWRNVRELTRVVRSTRPDLIHCTLADASLASRIVGRFTGTPVVESLVNISHESVRTIDNPAVKPWKLAVHRLIDRLTMRWVAHFHALTATVRDSWVSTVGIDPDKVTIIPRGIDFDTLEASVLSREEEAILRKNIGVTPDEKILLMVGRQEAQKGHRIALDAMAALKTRVPTARLVLAGRAGNRTEAIEQQIREQDLDKFIVRLGAREDVHALMMIADVFVFPSLFEGLGVSLIEAMGHGLPVVVLDRPPMNQIVSSETGFIATPDGSDLADVIGSVLAHPDRAITVGRKAREAASARYRLETTSARMLELYRAVAGGPA